MTTRAASSQFEKPALQQLSADRPEPASKKSRHQRIKSLPAHTKRIVQSLNPSKFSIDWAKCPRLAIKFPHLQSGANVSETMAHVQVSEELILNTADVQSVTTGASTLSPPVALAVQKTVRKFKYPVRGAATSSGREPSPSCGTVLPLREGSVRTEEDMGDAKRIRSHYRGNP